MKLFKKHKQHEPIAVCRRCNQRKSMHVLYYDQPRHLYGPSFRGTFLFCEECFETLSFKELLYEYRSVMRDPKTGYDWNTIGKLVEGALAREKKVPGYVTFLPRVDILLDFKTDGQ